MFENKKQPVIPKQQFYKRLLKYAFFSFSVIAFSLLGGMAGYRYYADLDWYESFYNASMILTGMGPALDLSPLTEVCKQRTMIFAGFYALYSGVVFISAAGLLMAPVLHRFFHVLHLEGTGEE